MKVEIPLRTYSLTNTRGHWAKRHRRAAAERRAAYLACHGIGKALPCEVTLTRVGPRRLDDDNLRGALKSVRDGVADRLGVDDGDPRVIWWYEQRLGKEHAVEIQVQEVEECTPT